ncbi:MAG: TrmH family RNA methyltransferase [Acidobacteriota bacterium]
MSRRGARLPAASRAALRWARRLERSRPARESEGLFLAWGRHLALEAVAAGFPLRRALVGESLGASREGRAILAALRRSRVDMRSAPARALDSIVAGSGDQGVVLLVERRADTVEGVLDRGPTLVVVIHGVQDPGNVGSIARTSLAFGADALIALEGCADPFGSRAVRAGMGAHFRLPVICGAATYCLERLRARGLQVVAADPGGEATPPHVDLRRPSALLLGSEGAGLPTAVLATVDRRVRVPMAATVSSLNVHAAASVLLYEASRQRGLPPAGRARAPDERDAPPLTGRSGPGSRVVSTPTAPGRGPAGGRR